MYDIRCPQCNEPESARSKFLDCDGYCGKSYHIKCLGIPAVFLEIRAKFAKNISYRCNTCHGSTLSDAIQLLNKQSSTLAAIQRAVETSALVPKSNGFPLPAASTVSTVPPAVSTSPSAKDDHTKPPDSAQSLNSAENVNRNTGAVPKMQRSTSSSACSRRLRNPLDETVTSEKALPTVHNNVASTSSQESMHQASQSVLNSPAMPSYIRVASTGSTPLIQRPPCDELRSTEPPILSRSIAPTTGQYPQPPQQVLNRNTAAPLSDIVPVANEAPLPATAIYPGTSSIHTSGPKLKVASPPKQLFISRLAFTTSTDDVLEYIRSKVGLLSSVLH